MIFIGANPIYPINKNTSILLWFLNEQAKAFTEVFFIYKPTFRVISAININSILSAQRDVKPFSEWRVTLIGK